MQEILTSCRFFDLSFLVKLLQVKSYVLRGGLEKLRHEGLTEPERLVREAALDAGSTVIGLVEDDFPERSYWLFGHGRDS
ncbi:MAG: hypothetical protein IT449_14735 [Phycisphaerales bacterium]|nr:hypothetical protein [Phycisphaerales bacterium]